MSWASRRRYLHMSNMVMENLKRAQEQQKQWYDRNARERTLEEGEKVLVLLPTSSNKLLAQWQGPYTVIKKTSNVTYQIDMHNKRKRLRIFHINMLRKWHEATESSCWVEDIDEGEEEIPVWKNRVKDQEDLNLPDYLDEDQRQSLLEILQEYLSRQARTDQYDRALN